LLVLLQIAVSKGYDENIFNESWSQLDSIVGAFTPDLDALKEEDWVTFVMDASLIARKIVVLKTFFPSLDVPRVLNKKPKLFLKDLEELRLVCEQVQHLLKEAPNPGVILSETPDLFDPAMVASVLISFQRWFPKDDPVQKLQADGAGILQRAQDNDIPLDPVYYDGTTWRAPAFDTQAEQLPWQEHIRTKVNKLPPLSTYTNSGKFKAE